MSILNCVYKSREINIGFLEFSCGFDSSKFGQSRSLIHMRIEIPHQNMYNDMQRHWFSFMSPVLKKLSPISVESLFSKIRWTETPFKKKLGQFRDSEDEDGSI